MRRIGSSPILSAYGVGSSVGRAHVCGACGRRFEPYPSPLRNRKRGRVGLMQRS